MTYSRLLLVSLIVLVALSIPTVVILSQGSTRQVGSAKCDLYTEQSGVRCARINCDVTGYNLPGQSTNHGCEPTHPAEQNQLHCESQGGPSCEVITQMSCNAGNRSAGFGRSCTQPDGSIIIQTVDSTATTCPVTCPGCPTPSGRNRVGMQSGIQPVANGIDYRAILRAGFREGATEARISSNIQQQAVRVALFLMEITVQ